MRLWPLANTTALAAGCVHAYAVDKEEDAAEETESKENDPGSSVFNNWNKVIFCKVIFWIRSFNKFDERIA